RRSFSIACAPAPETDWYVASRTRARPASSYSGFSAIVSGIVAQFGFATMPSCSSARSPFTSGTTSGIPASRRYAADLSTQTAPPRTACGTSSRRGRPDGEETEIELSRAQRLRSRFFDDAAVDLGSGGPRRREVTHVVVAALAQQLDRDAADRARRSDYADPRQGRTPRAAP